MPVADAQITFSGSGKVELAQGATGYYGDRLFISADETGLYKWDGTGGKVTLKGNNVTEVTAGKVIARANTGIAATTTVNIAAYTWTTDAGGDGKAGWKAKSGS